MEDQSPWAKQEKNLPWASFQLFYVAKLHITGLQYHSSHLLAVNKRFSSVWNNHCTFTHFQTIPGFPTHVYDSGAHGTVSDYRPGNISTSVLKGQLISTLQKALLQLLKHISALQEFR